MAYVIWVFFVDTCEGSFAKRSAALLSNSPEFSAATALAAKSTNTAQTIDFIG
jgi:hypothetical protein